MCVLQEVSIEVGFHARLTLNLCQSSCINFLSAGIIDMYCYLQFYSQLELTMQPRLALHLHSQPVWIFLVLGSVIISMHYNTWIHAFLSFILLEKRLLCGVSQQMIKTRVNSKIFCWILAHRTLENYRVRIATQCSIGFQLVFSLDSLVSCSCYIRKIDGHVSLSTMSRFIGNKLHGFVSPNLLSSSNFSGQLAVSKHMLYHFSFNYLH